MTALLRKVGAESAGDVEGVEDVEANVVGQAEDDHFAERSGADSARGLAEGGPRRRTALSSMALGRLRSVHGDGSVERFGAAVAEGDANGSAFGPEDGDAPGDVVEDASESGVGLSVVPDVGDGESSRSESGRRRNGVGGGRNWCSSQRSAARAEGAESVLLGGVGEQQRSDMLRRPVEEGLSGEAVEVDEELTCMASMADFLGVEGSVAGCSERVGGRTIVTGRPRLSPLTGLFRMVFDRRNHLSTFLLRQQNGKETQRDPR
jgi:hypothetical protein